MHDTKKANEMVQHEFNAIEKAITFGVHCGATYKMNADQSINYLETLRNWIRFYERLQ